MGEGAFDLQFECAIRLKLDVIRSYDRIAEQFGISEGAVKVRVHRAMKELKAAFLADAALQAPETGEAG